MSICHEKLVLQHFDPDALLQILNGMDMEHRLLGREKDLSVHIEQLSVNELNVTFGDYNFPVLARGATPVDGSAYLGIHARYTNEFWTNKNLTSLDQLALYAPGCELHVSSKQGSSWFMLQFPLEQLQETAINIYGEDIEWPREGVRHLDISTASANRLRNELGAFLRSGELCAGIATEGLVEVLAAEELMQLLAFVVLEGSKAQSPKMPVGQKQALDVFEQRIDRCLKNPDAAFRVSGIDEINQRTLERACRNNYGVTPHRWLKLARLNAAHKDLCSSKKSVLRVCEKWGFNHLGRFSGEYCDLFGELPRETLRRVSARYVHERSRETL